MAQPFTIYVTQFAHTDIGYTHPQEQIAGMYVDYYDRVLELCARDEIAPVEHRFKWTCETAWQVRNYLAARPERLGDFLYFARNGQIEVTASYLHFTDLIDAEAYGYSLQWAVEFCRQNDLPLRCAMHSDINGWAWAIPDLLAERNIPYFISQVHIDSATDPLGKRGSIHYHWVMENGDRLRPDVPIRVPQGFWWQGPGGNKILHWLNEHYHLGNFLGLSATQGFATEKSRYFWESDRTSVDDLYATAQREIPKYIERIQREGYPYDAMMICTSGYWVDNSPPDDRWCEIIARWNAEHDDIHLRTATMSEWFDQVTQFDTASFPTRQVAWPDHWAHGLGTMGGRIAQARRVQRGRKNVKSLVEQSGSSYATAHLATARDQELLALEHTFNAWMTTWIPYAEPINFLQAAKELNFQRAELHYHEAAGAALRAITEASDGQSLYALFDDDAPLRVVEFTGADLRLDPSKQMLLADDGQAYPFQRDSHADDMPRFVAALPGQGLARFRLIEREAGAAPTNTDWAITVDSVSGALTSLSNGREWIGQADYGFGQLVHENVIHPLGRQAVGNLRRLIVLGDAAEPLLKEWIDAPIFEHTTPTFEGSLKSASGAVFDTHTLDGNIGTMGKVQINWRVYHALPLVELVIDWDKTWNELPEAAYVAFPFAADHLKLETAGGFFQPGSHEAGGQLAGTCSSYYTIQCAAQIEQDGASLLWLPLDAPLVMPQAINYNRWETDPYDWNGFLASMPINHYWHTNFASSQRGYLRFRYRLFSRGSADQESAIRTALPLEAFGWR
ncbi:MAG TPA: hypothetical protein VHD90_13175 [Phototrophicaceae bacterium]|nr:hypothetical protein [Phototrophicaceae bacterium]